MIYYCAHCDYNSHHVWDVRQHQSRKHKREKKEVDGYQQPIQREEQPINRDLMEDSVLVFKIYKLLQRMKNK